MGGHGQLPFGAPDALRTLVQVAADARTSAEPQRKQLAVRSRETPIEPAWIWFDRDVQLSPNARRLLRRFARMIVKKNGAAGSPAAAVINLDHRAKQKRLSSVQRQRLRVSGSVLSDLTEHGWRVRLTRRAIEVASPLEASSPEAEKERVRRAHLIERDNQIAQPATLRFIHSMERRRLTKNGWKSIFSLMRDGRDFAAQLDAIRTLAHEDEAASAEAVRASIDPYVQVISPGEVDQFTGLKLMHIWRYFRHTWSTTYQSTPGRRLFILIRDRAAPDHPVVGIGAVGSAIVQMSERDRWIGWNSETFLADLERQPSTRWAKWLVSSLSTLIDSIYTRDFIRSRVLTAKELEHPVDETLARLRSVAKRSKKAHRLFAHVGKHKVGTRSKTKGKKARSPDWRKQAVTYLFQAKRASTLADLLDVRRRLITSGFAHATPTTLRESLTKPSIRRAIQTVLRHMRAVHVGVDMLDITVCGAIAPYRPLLGGKLVSLLMASPELVRAYQKRYRNAESVIASSMAGRSVRRRPRLVLLGTTSLYGVASSQYNRLVVPASVLKSEMPLEYVRLGHTAGFGSYHFSRETMAQLEVVSAQARRGREVNSIFGEGVNPKLRKVRAALDFIGLPSDELLQHGSPRLIYAVPLATNFREVLLGSEMRPKYLLHPSRSIEGTQTLIDYWSRRWLVPRIGRPGVLDAVRGNSLVYPIQHAARVQRTTSATDAAGAGSPEPAP